MIFDLTSGNCFLWNIMSNYSKSGSFSSIAEVDPSDGYVTFSLTDGPEYHVSQVTNQILCLSFFVQTRIGSFCKLLFMGVFANWLVGFLVGLFDQLKILTVFVGFSQLKRQLFIDMSVVNLYIAASSLLEKKFGKKLAVVVFLFQLKSKLFSRLKSHLPNTFFGCLTDQQAKSQPKS